ncbi:MAG: hypothetical protein H5T50_09515 [Nitrososphaeria archaeon]|nr:hypothetical protein [Nitrososphaeria archaeon]
MNEESKIRRLLIALAGASGPVTVDYILLHSKLDNPQEFLEILEKRGLVKKIICSEWSPCMNPRYQLTSVEKVYEILAGNLSIKDLEKQSQV